MTDLELLQGALRHEGGYRKVAKKVGVSPATLCLIAKERYPSSPKKAFDALRREYGFLASQKVLCPALRDEIHFEICAKYAKAALLGKNIGGSAFALVKDVCAFCPNSKKEM